MKNVNDRIAELGIEIPKAPSPIASYIPSQRTGNLIYVSGQDCKKDGVLLYEGKLGKDLSIQEGSEAAKQCILNSLAIVQEQIGDLNKVIKIIKLTGFVNSADGFVEQPYVINGASNLLEELFGERGKHARAALGSNELPFNTPVEIEMIVEVED